MTEVWVGLLIAGALLLIGFAASLAFERFRIPDFFVLILLGMVLGNLPVEPFGPGMVDSLQPVLPSFTMLCLAIILFEGGLTFRLGVGRAKLAALLGHIVFTMALSFLSIWYIGLHFLGMDSLTSLIFAAAFSGPSASIGLSFASRLKASQKTSGSIVLEGVLTNVIAAVLVLFLLRFQGTLSMGALAPYVGQILVAVIGAFAWGLAWHAATERLTKHKFVHMATIAWMIVVYAVFQGFGGENGPVAAFVFGVAVAYRFPKEKDDGAVMYRDDKLKTFQSEITFAFRTFFFVYLGLLITFEGFTLRTILSAGLITLAMMAARIPSSIGLGFVFNMTARETRLVISTVARGMTDVILMLIAIQSGLISVADTDLLIGVMTLIVLMSAIATAGQLYWAERGTEEAPGLPPKA